MVYAFFGGMFVGLPIGCYLREKGYHSKAIKAYEIFNPKERVRNSEVLKSKS